MIASALAGDDILTAAQVSRKLKQLGLHVPRRKRAEGNMQVDVLQVYNHRDASM